MRRGPTVGIHNNFTTSQTGIPIRAADDKFPGRVHVPNCFRSQPAFGHDLADVGLDDLSYVARGEVRIQMLRRQNKRTDPNRLATFIAYRQLRFCIRAKPRLLSGFPNLGQPAQYGMGVVDRGRHQLVRLVDRVAEHDALIARALVLVLAGIDALRDVRGLRM